MQYTVEMLNKILMRNSGSLYLDGCTGLTALPDNLTVGGWIYRDGRKFKCDHND